MPTLHEEISTYICVDIETAGPNPSQYALLSIGACTLGHPRKTFYIETRPDRMKTDDRAMAVHGLNMDNLLANGTPVDAALRQFQVWIEAVSPTGEKPIFVAFNAPFDWMFLNDYFFRCLGENPFGHSAIDIKAVYMGFTGKPWCETSGKFLHEIYNFGKPLTHNALEDAIDQAVIFEGLLAEIEKRNLTK